MKNIVNLILQLLGLWKPAPIPEPVTEIPKSVPPPEPQSHPKPVVQSEVIYPEINELTLMQIAPHLSAPKAKAYALALNDAMWDAEIDTPMRQAAFLAQLAHESDGFKTLVEYGKDSYFRRYDNRSDLGNVFPGDGLRFKGRGFIQITGRYNYRAAGKALGLDLLNNPALAETPVIAARIAAWYWTTRGLNKYADLGDMITITKRINGGLNGLQSRLNYYDRAKDILEVEDD